MLSSDTSPFRGWVLGKASSGDAEEMRAADPDTSDEELAVLATSERSNVRMAVAENPLTPRHVLASLSEDPEQHVRAAAQAMTVAQQSLAPS